MAATKKTHWGNWIADRARHVGFLTQGDLAASVGSERNRIGFWFRMADPPDAMRKGFAEALAAALKTDRITLFAHYASIPAADAPIVDTPCRPQSVPTVALDPAAMREAIITAVVSLSGDRLRIVYAAASAAAGPEFFQRAAG